MKTNAVTNHFKTAVGETPSMVMPDVTDKLCVYDERNPMEADLNYGLEEDEKTNRSDGCACDNCFYGRDPLAQEVIKLRAENQRLRGALAGCVEALDHIVEGKYFHKTRQHTAAQKALKGGE